MRTNFDSFLHSLLTVFILVIADDWNEILYEYNRAIGSVSYVYFIATVSIGNIILLNLFLAILLTNFEDTFIDES